MLRATPSDRIVALCVAAVLLAPALASTQDPSRRFSRLPLVSPRLNSSSAMQTNRAETPDFHQLRRLMVSEQIEARGVSQKEVLDAMLTVPRHLFVPENLRASAYEDHPLRIGEGQTISQPYVVALMTELLELDADEKVLEIGTGSGYHAAVMSRIAEDVYTVEIIENLAKRAEKTLRQLSYDNVHVRVADGYQGWPDEAPFDAIVLTAAPEEIPPPLLEQLKVGGRMVAPVGGYFQDLQLIIKHEDGIETQAVEAVRFVPMTGKARRHG